MQITDVRIRKVEKEGKMKCDPKEMVRLEVLANHK